MWDAWWRANGCLVAYAGRRAVFLVPVEKRDRETLLNVIKERVEPTCSGESYYLKLNMWTRDTEVALLEHVREYRHLWDHKDRLYSKQSLQRATYEKIAVSLRTEYPSLKDVTEEHLRLKFKNIKTYKMTQHKKIQNAKSGSQGSTQQRWYLYDHAIFLTDAVVVTQTQPSWEPHSQPQTSSSSPPPRQSTEQESITMEISDTPLWESLPELNAAASVASIPSIGSQEATQSEPTSASTPSSGRRKRRAEYSGAEDLMSTMGNYFITKTAKDNKPPENVDRYARHVSDMVYELLKDLPRQKQIKITQHILGLIGDDQSD
ncbi:hypothetical protein Pcinc_019925 [Petrolisthes cinctipes]|uniref:MADF domain-containing protein n=1 Tax=Petrolisthes cinctipes TaxID=88211 RepID=A0AAE1KM09_PETCI|nr:hypothetical protein Pcinc_019925 [Petrolisthes cinctipes]